MILTCPNCSTRFFVDGAVIPAGGRRVRCSSCAHVWLQDPPENEPQPFALEDDIRVSPAGAAAVAAEPARPRRSGGRRIGPQVLVWLLFLAILAAIVVGGWQFRQHLVDAWPAATRLYEAVGAPVTAPPGYGLALEVRNFTRSTEEGAPALVVEGAIRNVSDRPRPVPPIRAALLDSTRQEVQDWTFSVSQKSVAPGQSLPFRTTVRNPAQSATDLSLGFAGD